MLMNRIIELAQSPDVIEYLRLKEEVNNCKHRVSIDGRCLDCAKLMTSRIETKIGNLTADLKYRHLYDIVKYYNNSYINNVTDEDIIIFLLKKELPVYYNGTEVELSYKFKGGK